MAFSMAPEVLQKMAFVRIILECEIKEELSLRHHCRIWYEVEAYKGFPGGSEGKVSACNAGDLGSIPGPGRSPGEGNGNPLQYSCLENPMDREGW